MSDISTDGPRDPGEFTLKVALWRERREVEVIASKGDRVHDLISNLGIPVDGTLVLDGNVPVPIDAEVEGTMELKLISVASGG